MPLHLHLPQGTWLTQGISIYVAVRHFTVGLYCALLTGYLQRSGHEGDAGVWRSLFNYQFLWHIAGNVWGCLCEYYQKPTPGRVILPEMLLPDCAPWKLFLSSQAFVQILVAMRPLGEHFTVSFMLIIFTTSGLLWTRLSLQPTLFESVWVSRTPFSCFPSLLPFLPFSLFHLSPVHPSSNWDKLLRDKSWLVSPLYFPQPLVESNMESTVHSVSGLHELKL